MRDSDFELPEPVELSADDLNEVSGGVGIRIDPNG